MRMRRLWMVDPVWDPVSIRLYFWMFPPAPAFDSCPSVADAVAVLIDVNEIVMRWRGGGGGRGPGEGWSAVRNNRRPHWLIGSHFLFLVFFLFDLGFRLVDWIRLDLYR